MTAAVRSWTGPFFLRLSLRIKLGPLHFLAQRFSLGYFLFYFYAALLGGYGYIMKKLYKLLCCSCVCALAMLNIPFHVSAGYDVAQVAEEVTSYQTFHVLEDEDKLFDLAVEQAILNPTEFNQTHQLSINQTVARRSFRNGDVEEDRVKTVFTVADDVSLAELAADKNNSKTEDGSLPGVSFSLRINYTSRFNSILEAMTCRVNSVTGNVQNLTLFEDPAESCYLYVEVFGEIEEDTFSCSSGTRPQTFTLSSPSSDFNIIDSAYVPSNSPVSCGMTVTTSGGDEDTINMGLIEDDVYA